MRETSVLLGVEDRALQEEVLHFLERSPAVRVVGAAEDGPTFEGKLAKSRPDAAVATASVLETARDLDGAALFVIAEKESGAVLRAAIKSGARGFYLWPEERESLLADAGRSKRRVVAEGGPARGRVIAVYGVRGGAGVTFLSTHLAGMCSRLGSSVALVDADPFFGDVAAAIGVGPNERIGTITDLAVVSEELSAEHLDRVLYSHPRGFRVLLGPQDPLGWEALPPALSARAAEVLRPRAEVIFIDVPRGMTAALPSLRVADEIILVVTLDVLAFRDAQRVLSLLGALGLADRCRLVVNRAGRAEIVPADAERVFGKAPAAVVPADRAVARAQNRGELCVDRGGPATRAVRSLARSLLQGARS